MAPALTQSFQLVTHSSLQFCHWTLLSAQSLATSKGLRDSHDVFQQFTGIIQELSTASALTMAYPPTISTDSSNYSSIRLTVPPTQRRS